MNWSNSIYHVVLSWFSKKKSRFFTKNHIYITISRNTQNKKTQNTQMSYETFLESYFMIFPQILDNNAELNSASIYVQNLSKNILKKNFSDNHIYKTFFTNSRKHQKTQISQERWENSKIGVSVLF